MVKQSRAKEKKMKAKVVESESEEEALDDLDERDVKLVNFDMISMHKFSKLYFSAKIF